MATGEKISQLTELSKVADGDWLTVVDISESNKADQNKKISKKNLFADVLSEGTGNFTAWASGTTYETANKPIYVSHNGNVWKFVSGTNDTGTEPGTDDSVWELTSTGELAHQQNTDTLLAKDTADEVTAANLRAHLDNNTGNPHQIGLEDARGAGDTFAGNVSMGGNNLIGIGSLLASGGILSLESGIDIRSSLTNEHWITPGNGNQIRIGPSSGTARHSVYWNRLASNAQSPNGHAFEVNMDSAETMAITGGALQLNAGTSVNEIVTTVDGTSTNNQLATAAAVNTRVANWSLEDARGAGNVLAGNVDYSGNSINNINTINGNANASQRINFEVDGDISLQPDNGSGTRIEGITVKDTTGNLVVHNALQLSIGTSVNEISTTIDGTSTDDQLATAAAVNTGLTAATQNISEVLTTGNDAGNKSIINLSGLIVGDTTDASIVHFEDATASVNSFVQSIQSTGENGSVLSLEKTFGTDNGRFLVMGSPSNPEYYFDHSKLEVQPGLAVNVDNINQSSTNGLTLTAANGITLAGGDVVVNNKIYKSGHSGWTQVSTSGLYYKILPDNTVMLHGYVEATGTGGNTTVDLPNEARPASQWYIVGGLNSASIYPIRIESTGEIVIQTGTWSAGQQLQIDGIMYELERT